MAEEKIDTQRLRIFDRARWSKTSRYAVSGLVFIVIGGILVAYGLLFNQGSYNSAAGLVLGIGAIIVLVGIIRLLIGFINPAVPQDLDALEPQEEGEVDSIFAREPE